MMKERVCLVVDDEPAIRAYLKNILARANVQTLEASNAIQALRILQKAGTGIDLVVTDIEMAGEMDGVDLAHSVRNSHPSLPVILISGRHDGVAGGRFPFVQKPLPAQVTEIGRISQIIAIRKLSTAA
jgi:DNA-binding NtrC family response regulator